MLSAISLVAQTRCGVDVDANNEYTPPAITTSETQSRSTYIIPVVFHVITLSGESVLERKHILDQIDILNDSYNNKSISPSALPSYIRDHVGTPQIEFCLATLDPNGQQSSGINYVATSDPQLANIDNLINDRRAIMHTSLGGVDAWDTKQYLNVWIAHRTDGILGDSSFPNGPEDEDGIVMNSNYIGANQKVSRRFDLGKTLVHEVGHYLGLKHPWSGDCQMDDGIDDTPLQQKSYSGCPAVASETCGSLDFIYNYMDFHDDQCLLYFTKGQVSMMHSVLDNQRSELNQSKCSNRISSSDLDKITIHRNCDVITVLSEDGTLITDLNLSLFDTSGRLLHRCVLLNEYSHHIDISQVSTGVYLVYLSNKETSRTEKLFIAKWQ